MVGRPDGGPLPVCGFLTATRAAPWDRAASRLPDDECVRLRAADRLPSALGRQQFDCLLALLWADAALVTAACTSRASTASIGSRTDGVTFAPLPSTRPILHLKLVVEQDQGCAAASLQ